MSEVDTQYADAEDGTFTTPKGSRNTNNGKRRKPKKVPLSFASDVVGMRIRNAATGSEYDERVGSVDEKRFFKVSGKSRVKYDKDGNMIAEGYDMSLFYYDNPEQYEKHRNVTLSQTLKDEWHGRRTDTDVDAQSEVRACPPNLDDDPDLDAMVSRLKNTVG